MAATSLQIQPKVAQSYLHGLSEYAPPVLRIRIFHTSLLLQFSGLQIVEPSLKVQLQINSMPVNKLPLVARGAADRDKIFSHTKHLCSSPWVRAIRNLRFREPAAHSDWMNCGVATIPQARTESHPVFCSMQISEPESTPILLLE